jgi:hypothetical protein
MDVRAARLQRAADHPVEEPAMVSSRAFGRSLVLALVVIAAAVPASAQNPGSGGPVVGPEAPVSRPVPGAPRHAREQAVAYGGGVFLVAWVDGREQLWATRVDRNGAVIDQSGIALSTEPGYGPAVAFDGTNFLVVWGGSGPIKGRRVSPGGAVLDPAPIELSTSGGLPAVSFGGGSYLVVWAGYADDADSSDVFATRLSPDGVVLQPANVPIVTPFGYQNQVDIAFNGTHHLVVWDQMGASSTDVYGTLVTADGVALGPGQPISAAAGEQLRPVVTAAGPRFFVVWEDRRQEYETYGARVRADGSVIDGSGIRIVTPDRFYHPSSDVSWDGVNVLVTWSSGPQSAETVRGSRVDPSGTLLDPAGVELVPGLLPGVAFDGTRYLVTSVTSGGYETVGGTRVTPGLTPLDPGRFHIAVGANQQTEIDLASDGVNHLVVWTDNRTPERPVYGARVGPDGQNLDGAGFPIAGVGEPSTYTGAASVVFDGTNFLVLWAEGHSFPDLALRAARISPDGEILDRFDIAVRYASLARPEVAVGNGMFLVGWSRMEDVVVARVRMDGTVLDPEGIQLDPYVTYIADIDIAAGASEFLVVWNDGFYFGPEDDNDVLGAVVTTDGTVVDNGIPIASGPDNESQPAVAWQGSTYLVVWGQDDADGNGSSQESDIHGIRVTHDGKLVDPSPLPISTAPGEQHRPDVAFNNGQNLVTWHDRRRYGPTQPGLDVYGVPVGSGGTVGTDVFISTIDPYADDTVVIAAPGDDDDFAVAYGRYLPEPPYGTTRAFVRRVSPK